MENYSPALSATSDLTDEELDKYFASCVPLSNLPTPPPVKEHAIPRSAPYTWTSQTSQTLQTLDRYGDADAAQFQAHATHLANLVPLNASTHRPHAPVIHGFLDRAGLPEEIIAFSACVLDALSARFAAAWRDALAPSEYARGLQNFLRSDSKPQQVHVSPDIIVLAALSLAHGFLVDRWRSSRHWSLRESDGAFSVQEIEATQRAILQDLDYGLFRISNEAVQRQLGYMRCPVPVATAMKGVSVMKVHRSRNLSMSLAGTAKWCHGVQTPEPSP